MKTISTLAIGLLLSFATAAAAGAQAAPTPVIVTNIPTVNTPTLNSNTYNTYLKATSQLTYQIRQWQMEYSNFQHFGAGSWLNLSSQLQQIEGQVRSQIGLRNGDPYGADAQAQEQLLQQDLAAFQNIQRLNDAAVGSTQVQQATNYFLNSMVSDSLKQRKLQIDQAMMEATGRKNWQIMQQNDLNVYVRP